MSVVFFLSPDQFTTGGRNNRRGRRAERKVEAWGRKRRGNYSKSNQLSLSKLFNK
jgi:hypothetical protein